jgi:hypothetical protein
MIGETEVAHVWAEVDKLDRPLAWHWRITHRGVKDGIPAIGQLRLQRNWSESGFRLRAKLTGAAF